MSNQKDPQLLKQPLFPAPAPPTAPRDHHSPIPSTPPGFFSAFLILAIIFPVNLFAVCLLPTFFSTSDCILFAAGFQHVE